jgi:hypothetical protein
MVHVIHADSRVRQAVSISPSSIGQVPLLYAGKPIFDIHEDGASSDPLIGLANNAFDFPASIAKD